MDGSSSSMGASNAITGEVSLNGYGEVKCLCGKLSVVKTSMTDDNPWRRFYSCGNAKWSSCNFFKWLDVDRPYGWQKSALVQARDKIREQREELKKLRDLVGHENANVVRTRENSELCSVRTRENSELCSELESENKKLKANLVLSIEKEKLLRQFVIISWIGFVGVTAVIVKTLK